MTGQTLTARVLACMAADEPGGGDAVWTARVVAARLGEDRRRVSRCLARLASRGEAVRRDCWARTRTGRHVYRVRVYRTTADLWRAAARRGVALRGPPVEAPVGRDELTVAAVLRVDSPCCPPLPSPV